jgi:hypothetical protein
LHVRNNKVQSGFKLFFFDLLQILNFALCTMHIVLKGDIDLFNVKC